MWSRPWNWSVTLGYWFLFFYSLVIGFFSAQPWLLVLETNLAMMEKMHSSHFFFFFQSAPRAAGGLSLTSAVTFDLSSQPWNRDHRLSYSKLRQSFCAGGDCLLCRQIEGGDQFWSLCQHSFLSSSACLTKSTHLKPWIAFWHLSLSQIALDSSNHQIITPPSSPT